MQPWTQQICVLFSSFLWSITAMSLIRWQADTAIGQDSLLDGEILFPVLITDPDHTILQQHFLCSYPFHKGMKFAFIIHFWQPVESNWLPPRHCEKKKTITSVSFYHSPLHHHPIFYLKNRSRKRDFSENCSFHIYWVQDLKLCLHCPSPFSFLLLPETAVFRKIGRVVSKV